MSRCPITYEPLQGKRYSPAGLRLLGYGLDELHIFEYSAEEQRREAFLRAAKMSIQGVQPKLSAKLNVKKKRFEIVDRGGRFILKPQHPYFPQLPENEDLTMRLAEVAGLEVPLHGMIWSGDDSLTYFVKRFDRQGQKVRVPVEDFAQLAGLSRDTKYNYSLEKVVTLVDKYCTFPAVEKVKLFRLVLFGFITGNDDMHLKNFSIINRNGKIALSPCYDQVNTIIEYPKPDEEIALPLKGKKRNITRGMLVNYLARERCELTQKVTDDILATIAASVPRWMELIACSFLTDAMKDRYTGLIESRLQRLELA